MNVNLQSSPDNRKVSARAFTLIEALVYMSVLFVILGMGYVAMYRSMDASAGLRRSTDDIARALKAGERWREDIRDAAAPVRVENLGDNGNILHVRQARTEVSYRFADNRVLRRTGQSAWLPVLENVKASTFVADQRSKTTAWRWELELQLYRKRTSRIPELFTFISVPPTNPGK
jgi:Tfp pilus assembly protein FimT